MSFKLNTIRDNPGAMQARKVVGRGIGSGLGKTSGRGGKGQTARAGVSLNGFEGGQMPIYRRVPKRGFNNALAVKFFELHFRKLSGLVARGILGAGQVVDLNFLIEHGLVSKRCEGVSLVSKGELPFAVNFVVSRASAAAKAQVEKAGGSVVIG
jgi:large subunit ribosomal protein L15